MKVLSLNLGSSSLKYAVHECSADAAQLLFERDVETSSQPQAASVATMRAVADAVESASAIDAVGHRIVFGGEEDAPARVTPELLLHLESLQSLDPLHVPGSLAVIRSAQQALPGAVHVACFDTAFYRDLPRTARALPVPSTDPLLRRYGFHGLSYESVCGTLGPRLMPRAIVAHLGNGASVAALLNGKPVNMTMGFSPLGGVIMSTRPGDLDPGALLYLLERSPLGAAQLREMLETQSGLRALSGGESNVQKLCERSDDDAAFALEMFERSIAKAIGGLVTELGGLDQLVFTGGIGEHNGAVRQAILLRLRFLTPAPAVEVVKSDENLAIALHAAQVASLGLPGSFSKT